MEFAVQHSAGCMGTQMTERLAKQRAFHVWRETE